MANAKDMNAMMKDMMGAFPVDTKAMEETFKNQAALNEKLSAVALEAAEKIGRNLGQMGQRIPGKTDRSNQSKSRAGRLRQSRNRFCFGQC